MASDTPKKLTSARERLISWMELLMEVAQKSTDPDDRLLLEPARKVLGDVSGAMAAAYVGMAPQDAMKETPLAAKNRLYLMWHSVLKDTPYENIVEGLAERAVVLLEAKAQVTQPLMHAVAQIEAGQRTTEVLTQIVVEQRESGAGWNHVMSTLRQKGEAAADPKTMDRAHPLIALLGSTHLLASTRAEALAHFEMYVRSGHAAVDLGEGSVSHMKPGEQQAVLRLRAMTEQLAQGVQVPDAVLITTLEARFEQVFLRMRLSRAGNKNTLTPVTEGFSLRKTPGKGEIGILIRDAENPRQIWMACSTANTDTTREGDQIPRFAAAVDNAIIAQDYPFRATTPEQAQAIRQKAAKEERGLTPQESAEVEGGGTLKAVWLFSPALFPERNSQRGIMRDHLNKLTREVGGTWSQQLLDQVRALQSWRLLDSRISGSLGQAHDWIRTNYGAIGGTSGWQPGLRNKEDDQTHVLYGQVADKLAQIAQLGGAIAEHGVARNWQVRHANARVAEVVLTPLLQSMRGLWRHGQHVPHVVNVFQQLRGHMDSMARYMEHLQMTRDVEEWKNLARDVDAAVLVEAVPTTEAVTEDTTSVASKTLPTEQPSNRTQNQGTKKESHTTQTPLDKPVTFRAHLVEHVRAGASPQPQDRGRVVLNPLRNDANLGHQGNEFQERYELGRDWIAQHEAAWKQSHHWNTIKKSVHDMEYACCTEAMRILLNDADPRMYADALDSWLDGRAFRGAEPETQVTWARALAQENPRYTPKAARARKSEPEPKAKTESVSVTTPTENREFTGTAEKVSGQTSTQPPAARIKRRKQVPGRAARSTYVYGQITDTSFVPTGKFKRALKPMAQSAQENLEHVAVVRQKAVKENEEGHYQPQGVMLPFPAKNKPRA